MTALKTLLCFGDSNTHGTIPMHFREESARFGFDQRWPGVVQGLLGNGWRVIEEGMPGRTTTWDDPDEGEDRNALRYWQACVQSHRPVDAIAIMLGTNDLKAKFPATPQTIADGVRKLVGIALDNTPPGCAPPRVLVITPTPILEVSFFAEMFAAGRAKSLHLKDAFTSLSQQFGLQVLHAQNVCTVSALDGIHLDATAQRNLGEAVAQTVMSWYVSQ